MRGLKLYLEQISKKNINEEEKDIINKIKTLDENKINKIKKINELKKIKEKNEIKNKKLLTLINTQESIFAVKKMKELYAINEEEIKKIKNKINELEENKKIFFDFLFLLKKYGLTKKHKI